MSKVDLKKVLKPLLDELPGLIEEEENLIQKSKEVRAERARIEKVLRDVDLIEPKQKRAKRADEPSPIAPKLMTLRTEAQRRNLDIVTDALPDLKGEPFQIKMLENITGLRRNAIEGVIAHLRAEEKLRFLGNRDQIGRTYPGGKPAATFQEVG